MATKSVEASLEVLNYQTWFLKVPIHCEGCKKKVRKVLQNIDGVFTTVIDPQQPKVTVTGSVGVETLIKKLLKAGKHADIWPENLSEKKTGKTKNKSNQQNSESAEIQGNEIHKENTDENDQENLNPVHNSGGQTADRCNVESRSRNTRIGRNSPEKPSSNNPSRAVNHKVSQIEGGARRSGSRKKSTKGGIVSPSNAVSATNESKRADTGVGDGMGPMNFDPSTRQQSYTIPQGYYPFLANLGSYNRLYPVEKMDLQSTPSVSFEILSDENANGCAIM